MNVDLLFDDNEVLDIRLPAHVALEVKNIQIQLKILVNRTKVKLKDYESTNIIWLWNKL